MIIEVYVTANAKVAKVTQVGDHNFDVRVDERAIEGRANRRLIEILSEHFHVPKSRISIVKGRSSRNKRVQILDFEL